MSKAQVERIPGTLRARRCIVSLSIQERDAMLKFFAVCAAETCDPQERARIQRFGELIESGELV